MNQNLAILRRLIGPSPLPSHANGFVAAADKMELKHPRRPASKKRRA